MRMWTCAGCGCTSGLGGCWARNPQKPIRAASGRREGAEPLADITSGAMLGHIIAHNGL
ncbi:hypothetical protein BD310DRAFT_933575 [Dichomitus squalens]|uniref:Uncharacterized protein n=1 Tax=Dichomitus squalens TaxID=114155 RepID=A0A4V2K7B9_9APHY|nr:hypothetical protein BD310DRAFT_933575 [Dichomitus squalens]